MSSSERPLPSRPTWGLRAQPLQGLAPGCSSQTPPPPHKTQLPVVLCGKGPPGSFGPQSVWAPHGVSPCSERPLAPVTACALPAGSRPERPGQARTPQLLSSLLLNAGSACGRGGPWGGGALTTGPRRRRPGRARARRRSTRGTAAARRPAGQRGGQRGAGPPALWGGCQWPRARAPLSEGALHPSSQRGDLGLCLSCPTCMGTSPHRGGCGEGECTGRTRAWVGPAG